MGSLQSVYNIILQILTTKSKKHSVFQFFLLYIIYAIYAMPQSKLFNVTKPIILWATGQKISQHNMK